MPAKSKYAKGERGSSLNSVRPGSGRTLKRSEAHSGQGGPTAGTAPSPADWGSDTSDDGSELEGTPNPRRNGGMRYFRAIDMADREDREAQGKDRLKYSWRSLTGPAPTTTTGDKQAAQAYLNRLNHAIDVGGWTSSEAAGLYLAKRVWQSRAKGEDHRYAEVGNKSGGLDKQQTANVKQRQIVADMRKVLDKSFRSGGD